ncbi:MucBP domain-containing protein [Lacticaseibacillus absianus]|uniref:MucBP domain-containing protein n=1 Tax=Lacticaseibacillus absianus TaxID=2729623 RepID=UPI0015CEEAD7|nr:MucBP domain-containing protein [Lacticaseibacillus absianus]
MFIRHHHATALLIGAAAALAIGAVPVHAASLPSTTTPATRLSRPRALSTHADTDPVTINDPQLKAGLRKAFGIKTGELTYGDIRHVDPNSGAMPNQRIVVNLIPDMITTPLTDLTGLEALRELPSGWSIQLKLFMAPGVSLVPLTGLHIAGNISLQQDGAGNWTDADITALNSLTFGQFDPYWGLELAGVTNSTNTTGLRNEQLRQLDPLFTKAAAASPAKVYFSLSGQRLSDFSYFAKFTNTEVFSVNNYRVFQAPAYAAQTGEDLLIHSQTIGIDGQPVATGYHTYNSATPEVTVNGHDYLISQSRQYGKIGYTIIDNQYGYVGYPYPDPVTYPNGNTLVQTGMEYYRTTWGNLFVRYVDRDGHPLAEATHLTGDVGQAYTTTPLPIKGYTVQSIEGAPTGTYTAAPQTVTYVYDQDPIPPDPTPGHVHIHVQDEQGAGLAPVSTLNGVVDQGYTITPPALAGYTFVRVGQGALTGTYTATDQDVILIYRKTPVPAEKPHTDGPQKPGPAAHKQPAPQKPGPKATKAPRAKRQPLPQAGDAKAPLIAVSGVALIVALLALGWRKRRS